MNNEVRCTKCQRMLAKIVDGKLEIIHGQHRATVYGQGVVCLRCDRCQQVKDLQLPTGVTT